MALAAFFSSFLLRQSAVEACADRSEQHNGKQSREWGHRRVVWVGKTGEVYDEAIAAAL
jgi:hypothetical protein